MLGILVLVVALGACGSGTEGAGTTGRGVSGRSKVTRVVRVVASTAIYADLARRVGGPDVIVTTLIDDPSIDPHEFQGTARDVLALSRADVVIVNGGGYDAFMEQLIAAAHNPDLHRIDAVEVAGAAPGANEHVFYDPAVMRHITDALQRAFSAVAPAHAAAFRYRAARLDRALSGLGSRVDAIIGTHRGEPIAATDPAAAAFADVAELDNRVGEPFIIAVENGTGAAPRAYHAVDDLVADDEVRVFITAESTADPQVAGLVATARKHRVPVVSIAEMLPPGVGHVAWMTDNFTRLGRALDVAHDRR